MTEDKNRGIDGRKRRPCDVQKQSATAPERKTLHCWYVEVERL